MAEINLSLIQYTITFLNKKYKKHKKDKGKRYACEAFVPIAGYRYTYNGLYTGVLYFNKPSVAKKILRERIKQMALLRGYQITQINSLDFINEL